MAVSNIRPLQSMPVANRKLSRKKRARRAAKQAKKQLIKIIRRIAEALRRNNGKLSEDQFDELGLIGIVPSHTLEYAYSLAQAEAQAENRSTFEPYDASESVVSEITNDMYCLRAASTDRGFEERPSASKRASIQSPEFSFSHSVNNRKKSKSSRFSFGSAATPAGLHSQDGSAIQDLYSRDCRERERYHKIREGQLHLTTVVDTDEHEHEHNEHHDCNNNDERDNDNGKTLKIKEEEEEKDEEPIMTEQPVVVEASSTLTSKSDVDEMNRRNSVVLDLGGFFGCADELKVAKNSHQQAQPQPRDEPRLVVKDVRKDENDHRPIDVDEFNAVENIKKDANLARKKTKQDVQLCSAERKSMEVKQVFEKSKASNDESEEESYTSMSTPRIVHAIRVDSETEASSSLSSTEDTLPSTTTASQQRPYRITTSNLPAKRNKMDVTPSKYPKGARWGVNLTTVKDRPKWIETDLPLIGDGVYPSAASSSSATSASFSQKTIATGESSQGIDSILSSCTEEKINSILGAPPFQKQSKKSELLLSPVKSPAAPKHASDGRRLVHNVFSPVGAVEFDHNSAIASSASQTNTASTVEESDIDVVVGDGDDIKMCDDDVDVVMKMRQVRPSMTSHRQPSSQNTAFSSIDWKKQPSVSSSQWSKNTDSQRSLMQSVGYSMTSLMNALSPKTNCSKQAPMSRARFSSVSTAKHSLSMANKSPPRSSSTRKSVSSVQSRVAAINQKLLSKRIVRKKEERRETAGDGVLCPRKSKLVNPLFRHHSSPTLPSMAEAYEQQQCDKEGDRASSVFSDEVQHQPNTKRTDSFPRASTKPQSKFKLSRVEVFDDIMAADKENSPNMPRLRLESSTGVAVKPDAMNNASATPIRSSSELCLSPKRRTPHQAQKWRTLAAAYGTDTSYRVV